MRDRADERTIDANVIAGALADEDRRRVFAAIELGAGTLQAATASSGLPELRVAKALGRLVDSGLVTAQGALRVDGAAIAHAARLALQRTPSHEHAGEPPAMRKVLDAFVRDGRITDMPASSSKRTVVLDWLARRFEPGRSYREVDVTAMLDGHAIDAVTLRRSLVDVLLLDRSAGVYWRSGGTVDTERDPR